MSGNLFSKRFEEVHAKMAYVDSMSEKEKLDLLHELQDVHDEYEQLQLVVKRNANSLYGTSASKFFSLHNTNIAEDITCTGRWFAIIVDRAINNFFVHWADEDKKEETFKTLREFYPDLKDIRNYSEYVPDTKDDLCCYGDTDSRYLRMDLIYDLIGLPLPIEIEPEKGKKELGDFSMFLAEKFINKIIKETIDADCEKRNARKGFLKMAHEITTGKSIFIKKKKYIATPFLSDGIYHKTKFKFQGVELKKGSMSEKAKKIISKLIDKYLIDNYTNEQIRIELLKIINYIKLKKDKELVYLISSVSGLSNMKLNSDGLWVSDKTHIQMQIALSWNNFIKQNNLENQYRPAFEGQKMQYYYCNDKDYKVIGVPDDYDICDIPNLPDVDWNKMIYQTIVKPLTRYIIDKRAGEDVTDKDVEAFMLGVKRLNF